MRDDAGDGGTALWRRIAGDLERRIEAGGFPDGFPGEVQLAAEYGVSRGTIRAALRPLRERGMVSAERGRRPRIVTSGGASSYGAIYSLHEAVQAGGMRQHNRVLAQRIEVHPGAAARLELPADTELFHLARLRFADGEPLAVDRLWIPARLANPLLRADFTDAAVYRLLRDRCQITLHGATEETWAVAASAALAARLDCVSGAPLFKIHRTSCREAEPVEFRESYIVGERFSMLRVFGVAHVLRHPEPFPADEGWWGDAGR